MKRMTVSEINRLAELLSEVGRRELLPRFRRLTPDQVRVKDPGEVVTEADQAAEAAIMVKLKQYYPAALIVGEETCEREKGLPGRLAHVDLAILVDALDGTRNFVSGLPLFGMMVAVVMKGEIAACVIHDPLGGDWAIAVRGEGAWSRQPDGRSWDLRVGPGKPLGEMTGCLAWHWMKEPQRSAITSNLHKFAACFAFRCAAHEYRLLAAGQLDFLFFNKLLPWDQAPGWLLHHEAGGYSARTDGGQYRAGIQPDGLLCAPDEDSWHRIVEALALAPAGRETAG